MAITWNLQRGKFFPSASVGLKLAFALRFYSLRTSSWTARSSQEVKYGNRKRFFLFRAADAFNHSFERPAGEITASARSSFARLKRLY